jgi:hypothetical protein
VEGAAIWKAGARMPDFHAVTPEELNREAEAFAAQY